jgi:hypothetical protein
LNKWDFLMVFQDVRRPIRRLCKSAIAKPIFGSGKQRFTGGDRVEPLGPAANGRAPETC